MTLVGSPNLIESRTSWKKSFSSVKRAFSRKENVKFEKFVKRQVPQVIKAFSSKFKVRLYPNSHYSGPSLCPHSRVTKHSEQLISTFIYFPHKPRRQLQINVESPFRSEVFMHPSTGLKEVKSLDATALTSSLWHFLNS